ncbi:unnamed protein product, partial [Owenia fusiformis]
MIRFQLLANTNLIRVAKKAAKTILDTLNPSDRIGIVEFSTKASVAMGDIERTPTCFKEQLAYAIPQNKEILKRNVDKITVDENTNYTAAIETAFNLLLDSIDLDGNEARDKVILFLTDGTPTDPNTTTIFEAIMNGNTKLKNKVVILTYGIGSVIAKDESTQQILTAMANQTMRDETHGKVREGTFTVVEDASNLRQTMSSYYQYFSRSTYDSPIIATPYVDALGLGLVTSICLPVHHKGIIKGVACVDMTMSDLLTDITYFSDGDQAYAFMIDNKGRTIVHPSLPRPSVVKNDILFVPISNLERTAAKEGIIEEMKRGTSGKRIIESGRVFPRGASSMEGVYEVKMEKAEYSWERIERTNFTICVVIPVNGTVFSIANNDVVSGFVYHRTDLIQDPKMCRQYDSIVTKDMPSTFLAAKAFTNPIRFVTFPETKSTVDKIIEYMEGKNEEPFDTLKENIRSIVSVLDGIDSFWISQDDESTIRRYIATSHGIIITKPGVTREQTYDPTEQPWYLRALANRKQLTISFPHKDKHNKGYEITLSKSLSVGRQHLISDPVFGVAGIDFSIRQFYNFIIKRYPKCDEERYSCFIMDNSGFIVMHRDFVNCSNKDQQIEGLHVTIKEPEIAKHLIKNYHMSRRACINFEKLKDYRTWIVDFISAEMIRSKSFELYKLRDTNAFLGVKLSTDETTGSDDTEDAQSSCACSKGNIYTSTNYECQHEDETADKCE